MLKNVLSARAAVCAAAVGMAAFAASDVVVPLAGGPAGIDGLKLAALQGFSANMSRVAQADGQAPALKIAFAKTGEERRFLALEALPEDGLPALQAADFRCRLSGAEQGKARPALMAFEPSGGAWYKLGRPLAAGNAFGNARFSLKGLHEAAFSDDANGQLDWNAVRKVWFGLVIDGPMSGAFELSRAVLTDCPYRPDRPESVAVIATDAWSVGKNEAAKTEFTVTKEAPGGKPCTKFEFSFPGGGHMWAVPTQRVPEMELSAYHGVRLTYKATLPDGITGLLVVLTEEGGGGWLPPAPPPASADWTSVVIPFSELTLASWLRDENGKPDLDRITSIAVGAHGTASGQGGKGCIMLADIEFVPPPAK